MGKTEVLAMLGPPSGTQIFPDRNAERAERWEVNHSASLGETKQEAEQRLRDEHRVSYGIAGLPRRGVAWHYNVGKFDTTCFSMSIWFDQDGIVWASGLF